MKLTRGKLRKIIKEELFTETLKRFKVYVSGEKEPLILLGKNIKDVKQTAYQMIQNSSVKVRKVVKEQKLNEAKSTYKGIFPYDTHDPYVAGNAFERMFSGADHGYRESFDNFDWNDDKNWLKAMEEYHKEMFKIVDGVVAADKKAQNFWKTKDRIFKKWRKKDGSSSS